MWTGTITFGMAVIPVSLGTAVSGEELPLHQYSKTDGGRIRFEGTVAEIEADDGLRKAYFGLA